MSNTLNYGPQFRLQLFGKKSYYQLLRINQNASKLLINQTLSIFRLSCSPLGISTELINDLNTTKQKITQQWTDLNHILNVLTVDKKKKDYDLVHHKARRLKKDYKVNYFYFFNNFNNLNINNCVHQFPEILEVYLSRFFTNHSK